MRRVTARHDREECGYNMNCYVVLCYDGNRAQKLSHFEINYTTITNVEETVERLLDQKVLDH